MHVSLQMQPHWAGSTGSIQGKASSSGLKTG